DARPAAHSSRRDSTDRQRIGRNWAGMMVVESFAERKAPQSQTGLLVGVSAARLVGHFYILVLPVLLPLLTESLGVGVCEICVGPSSFNVVTGLTQAPMGFLVDRVGPRRVLTAGLCLGGLAFAALGFATTYPVLVAVAVLSGLANCVYHPADYALLA